jgi:hypothetical protein
VTRCCPDCAALRVWRRLLTDTQPAALVGSIRYERGGLVIVAARGRDGVPSVTSMGTSLADAVADAAVQLGAVSLARDLVREREAMARAATMPPPGHAEEVAAQG